VEVSVFSTTSEKQCEASADCFFDTDVLTHEEFFPPGQTVNTKFDILRRLLEGMRRKQADQLVREQLL
jgi:hypothetical protein